MDSTIRTRPSNAHPEGRARAARVAHCGHLYAARQGPSYGLAHKHCGDRMCPPCMERRQRVEAKLLRRFVEDVHARGSEVIFPTLTQAKQAIEHESCAQARARLVRSRQAVFNTKTKQGRALRLYFPGGVWFIEAAWSYKGKQNRDGSRVAFSGWHVHLHGLLELTAPPRALVQKLGSARARVVWRREAEQALTRAWLAENPEARSAAQKIRDVSPAVVGQVCKYPLKPLELDSPTRAREAALAFVSKRMHDAWGSWRGWKKRAQQLLDAERTKPEPPPIEFGDATIEGVILRAQTDARVYFDPPGGTDPVGVPARRIVEAIERDPRTLQRQAADAAGEGPLQARAPPGREAGATFDRPQEAR